MAALPQAIVELKKSGLSPALAWDMRPEVFLDSSRESLIKCD